MTATPTRDSSASPRAGSEPSPLWAVLTITFLNSLGTGVLTNGVYFLARHAYGFEDQRNFALGVVFGATYIAGALTIGPLLARVSGPGKRLSNRGVLIGLMLALASLCTLPVLGTLMPIDPTSPWASWPIWTLASVYGPLTGALWPITESFLSGGRKAHALRRATGGFNIVWSLSLVAAFWGMAPLVEPRPLTVILALGAIHLACIPVMLRLKSNPGAHTETAEPHPEVYGRLLPVFRVLLMGSYLAISALSPYLPSAIARTGLEVHWHTPLASSWLIARVGVFVLFERWHGWHGRWWLAIAGPVFIAVGFAGTLVFGSPLSHLPWAAAGISASLAAFGLGMGSIYAAALYYAMEVGSAEVDAGGKHEALIGIGYTAGPALMLVGTLL